jgi:hypothetical protein
MRILVILQLAYIQVLADFKSAAQTLAIANPSIAILGMSHCGETRRRVTSSVKSD